MKPYRKERVASFVQEVVSEAIGRHLNDPRVSPLTTVSRVEISSDLTVCKIFLTVIGDAETEKQTLYAIRHARGFIQRIVAKEINLRQCPELRFELDEQAKKVKAMMLLLDENRRLREEKEGIAATNGIEESEDAGQLDALDADEAVGREAKSAGFENGPGQEGTEG